MPSGTYGTEHQRMRAALLAQLPEGAPCTRCGHPMWPAAGDRVDLDHADNGAGYLGFAHSSPCRICSRRCNQSAGGQKGALQQGKQLRGRRCVICGLPYTASMAEQACCGQQPCVTELRRRRRTRQGDGDPPPPTGRVWLNGTTVLYSRGWIRRTSGPGSCTWQRARR